MFEGWPDTGDAVLGLLPARIGAPVNDVLDEMAYAAAGQGYLEWVMYSGAVELHTQLVEPEMVTDVRMLDAMTLCATRIATRMSMSQNAAEQLLYRAVVLRDRLPRVFDCLKHGLVSPRHIRTIISRTELIDGQDYAGDVDAAIADALRRKGSWSEKRMRDMTDRIVYRHDPDAVREQRARAKDDRNAWIDRGEHGMADVAASMTAENALLAFQNVCDLADRVCPNDGRTQGQRRSDASFTLQTGGVWECQCGLTDCTAAELPADTVNADRTDDAESFSGQDADTTTGRATAPRGYTPPRGDDAASTIDDADISPMATSDVPSQDPDDEPLRVHTSAPSVQPTHRPSHIGSDGLHAQRGSVHTQQSGATPPGTAGSPGPNRARTARCERPGYGNRRERRTAAKQARRLHAYTDPATAAGAAQNPGFLDGYGVVSADHIRDLLTHSGVRVHIMGNRHDATGAVVAFPSTQPADPYRPSAALQTFVRARDLYCVWPGCNRPATKSDLDHTTEYDHDNPSAGGQTSRTDLVALCRFHHLIKTFTGWLTDLFVDADGRTHTTVTTPEGLTVDGPAHTGEDLITGLSDIEFTAPPNPASRPVDEPDEPTRRRTRLADKYARRTQERERNKRTREDAEAFAAEERQRARDAEPDPPF